MQAKPMAPRLAPSWRLGCCSGYSCALTATGKPSRALASFSSQLYTLLNPRGLARQKCVCGPRIALFPSLRCITLVADTRQHGAWQQPQQAGAMMGGGQQNGLCSHLHSPAAGFDDRSFSLSMTGSCWPPGEPPVPSPCLLLCAGSCAHQDREEGFSCHHREVLQPSHS